MDVLLSMVESFGSRELALAVYANDPAQKTLATTSEDLEEAVRECNKYYPRKSDLPKDHPASVALESARASYRAASRELFTSPESHRILQEAAASIVDTLLDVVPESFHAKMKTALLVGSDFRVAAGKYDSTKTGD